MPSRTSQKSHTHLLGSCRVISELFPLLVMSNHRMPDASHRKRRLHHRDTVDRGQSQPYRDQCRAVLWRARGGGLLHSGLVTKFFGVSRDTTKVTNQG